jgi:eukaryotic-like serine/threonine-protein kinase
MIGTKLAHYEITSHLGSGGMGDVYQATDSKLGRSVAIKLLPEGFSHDTERVARFQREARVLASLNHSNIAAIYGVEETNNRHFLVMELVSGETLADRIKRGAIPIDEALLIAKQIAEALEEAHEKGIIHRDLKPANIKLTLDDKVKVLDFGLAKAYEREQPNAALSNSPTISMAATNAGLILGTAAYMSPEQARGAAVDKRSDLWAFGVVLYEMLTGTRLFEGATVSDTLAHVLTKEPDWNALPEKTPAPIRKLLRRCLEKDRKRRLPDAADIRLEIDDALAAPAMEATPAQRRASSRLLWIAVVGTVLVAVGLAVVRFREASPAASPETRTEITTLATTDPVSLAISPDGEKIAFVGSFEERPQLWLRFLDSTSSRPLAGTDYALFPFWSPDSRSIGFFAEGRLKRIDIDGGSVQILAKVNVPAGGAWNRDGVILFPIVPDSPLLRISVSGGEPVPATQLQEGQTGHQFPQFLPDSRHFLYYATGGSSQTGGVYLGELGSAASRHLLDSDSPAVYAAGHLLFVRQGTLFAQSFDVVRLELGGNPHSVADHIPVGGVGTAALSASAAGPIVYRSGSSGGKRQLIWFDRTGKEIARIGNPETATPAYGSISPDYRRLAVQRRTGENTDIWLIDLARGVAERFTSDPPPDIAPIWSPNGDRIVFSSLKSAVFNLYEKLVTGAASQELLRTEQSKQATDWSRDGRFLLYRSYDPKMDWDIWALPLVAGDRKPFPVVRTRFEERDGQFSPDGKWIAYQSNESGRFEIYVQPFPGPGARSLISNNGGAQVRWRRDGKELFYVALNGRLVAVPFSAAANGQAAETGSPIPLFSAHVGAVQDVSLQEYIVSPDGQRFLIDTALEETPSPITVILNWKPPAK